MRRYALLWFLLLVSFRPCHADEQPAGKVLKEVWEAAYLEGVQAGFVHSVYREVHAGERKLIEATIEMDLTLTRFQDTIRLNFIIGNHETDAGKVLAVVMRQNLSKDQRLLVKGKVEGKELKVHIEAGAQPTREKIIPWSDSVVGLWGQERQFANRKLTPNSSFEYLRYEPTLTSMIKSRVNIKDEEEVTLPDGRKQKLLRTETAIDKVMDTEFPVTVAWIDAEGERIKTETELPGVGRLTTLRTTQAQAMVRGAKAVVDIGVNQLIRLRTPIPRSTEAREVVYRIRLKGVANPRTALAQDDRQEIRRLEGEEMELVVRGRQEPKAAEPAGNPPAEYLKSNHFIRSDDAGVRRLADGAIEDEEDPWKKAVRIERWVHDHITNKTFTEAFATADEVAKRLEGDCTEHAVLAAAMCRAAGVPSRTAVGLIYVPRERAMGFHMWIEVWINGKWYALDPTLGQGGVGAGHVKITDQHWNDEYSMKPMMPVTRVLGKLQIDVVSIKH